MAFVVADANQNGFALTCDEYVLFFVYRDIILCENGDDAIDRRFAYTHQQTEKVVKRVCARRPIGELLEWEATDVPTDLRDHKCNRPNVVGKDKDYCC